MLFNSFDFAIFIPIVFCAYWIISSIKPQLQKHVILVSSYIFYAFWDWRFLGLIFLSTLIDFNVGKWLSRIRDQSLRKLYLTLSIGFNLGILGFFKYFNFFSDNFVSIFRFLGMQLDSYSLNIILPVGISFYTFQTMSYSIDIYRRKFKPADSFIAFAAFVSFFPQLVAGPIERASNLLPQFMVRKKFSNTQAVDGMRQMLWGFFKKLVIADNCAVFVDEIFNNSYDLNGSTLVAGAIFFSFQIYGDFSGYSDIAIGLARLFGYNLKQNFAFPYFSRDIAEFWRRWHISLSTWFRDYLYIPLGGSRGNKYSTTRNVLVVFLVSGLWHGANWTYIAWGAIHAFMFLPLILFKKHRANMKPISDSRILPKVSELLTMTSTFCLTTFAWIFFRSESIDHAFQYVGGIFNRNILQSPYFSNPAGALYTMMLIILCLLIEWFGRHDMYAIENMGRTWRPIWRWCFYAIIILLIGVFTPSGEQAFIYFQF